MMAKALPPVGGQKTVKNALRNLSFMMYGKRLWVFIISQFQTLSRSDCVTLFITLLGREKNWNIYQNALSV